MKALRFRINNNPAGMIDPVLFNTSMGYLSLLQPVTGSYNAALGANALRSNFAGNNNSAVGYDALYNNTSGNQNTAMGSGVLPGITIQVMGTGHSTLVLRGKRMWAWDLCHY